MPGWSRSVAPWPPRGTASAAAATSPTAIRAPKGSSSYSPRPTSSPITAPRTGSGSPSPRSPRVTPTCGPPSPPPGPSSRPNTARTMAEPVTYSGYLRLDQLLSAQQPKSTEHDEMLFIVIHQIYELWFKQLLHEFGKVQTELEAGSTTHAMRTLRRTLAILKIVVAQLDVLETMTPTQFTRFRDWLGTSSGFESAQFRELEAVLGRRDRMMVAQHDQGSAERERITAAMSRPSLFDSFVRYLAGQGYDVPAEILRRDVSQPFEASDAMQQVLKKVYEDDTDATAVCELLVDLDEGMQEWRYHHVKMVERTIGGRRGTGGSAGAGYPAPPPGAPPFPHPWGH